MPWRVYPGRYPGTGVREYTRRRIAPEPLLAAPPRVRPWPTAPARNSNVENAVSGILRLQVRDLSTRGQYATPEAASPARVGQVPTPPGLQLTASAAEPFEHQTRRPRIREKSSLNGNRPNHRPRAAPGPPQHPTPPGMTPGDSQGRPRATGARGLATHHRYVAVAGSLQPADLRPWRPNLASCGRLGGRAGP